MRSFAHRTYKWLRPRLYDLGILGFFRGLLSDDIRTAIMTRLGLAGFDRSLATGSSLPSWRRKSEAQGRKNLKNQNEPDGVNIIGDLRADTGLGEVTRQTIVALRAVNVPLAYAELAYGKTSKTNPLPEGVVEGVPYSVNLIDIHFSQFYDQIMQASRELFDGKYMIAYWTWELPRFPSITRQNFALVDEIWVYSHYVQDSIAQVSPIPVIRMPPAIEVAAEPEIGLSQLGLPENRFIFLFTFSPISMTARKHPFGFIQAFKQAFGHPTEGPLLILKTHHLRSVMNSRRLEHDLETAVASVGGILLDRNFSRGQMNHLLNACQCYVSLHRAEGFGLGLAEAMALGKPVIATAYSGTMDFMNPTNSYGVRYSLREITESDHVYQPEFSSSFEAGQLWAEPDLQHAAELMQYVYRNFNQAQQVGRAAKRHMAEFYSPTVIGKRIAARLAVIADYR